MGQDFSEGPFDTVDKTECHCGPYRFTHRHAACCGAVKCAEGGGGDDGRSIGGYSDSILCNGGCGELICDVGTRTGECQIREIDGQSVCNHCAGSACALSMGAWSAWCDVGDAMHTEILRATDPGELHSAEELLVKAQERIAVRLREIAARRVELTTDKLVAA